MEVQDRQDQVNGHVGPFCLHLRPVERLHAIKERAEAPVHRKKERLFFCEAGRPAKGRRGVFARMEGVPWCHVVDDMAAGSRHKL